MAAFCGINYDELKSVVTLTCTWDEGVNIRQGIEVSTPVVRKLEKGQSAVFCGEIFRARCGSVRIRLLDGSGYGSVLSAEGTAFVTAPPRSIVEFSSDNATVTFVTVRVNKSNRFLASYRALLKSLGFRLTDGGAGAAATFPSVLTFEHDSGIAREALTAAFTPLVQGHLAKFFAFPKPERNRSEDWWAYELWMEYKKEINIWAD